MILVIDVGNSHTVTGLYDHGKLIGHWRLKTDRDRTSDELAIRYHGLFIMEGIDPRQITDIVLASVVPTLSSAWIRCCERHFGKHLNQPVMDLSVTKLAPLVRVETDNPHEVGIDRLVNAYGAWHTRKTDLIVIDFGTAITFDCVTSDCVYIGGVILPGIAISLDALATRTAKLPMVDVRDVPSSLIGKNTVHAMQSGILYGYGAMVDGIVEGIQKEMLGGKRRAEVIATGGMANLIEPFTTTIEHIDKLLTLDAMELILHALKKKQ
ncbi:type III pantothenate kinase [Desulfotalea psychrophila]|uniref:Type III pantothenate kinase n=1 Tax=Desulfotalea psychrophila (strain LSv54 / DSM 12343) TaxID=177439 RepID=COAX_DESPS|nr:type III pantothenate kinase [Desulfotalea psychrophila]Q6AKW8.1 RecName: Full=Type III pantothenate kinase; AltName: Full=PanK-III; AltName: Full=Pantothenic acid kinase [Desulfotalea psychrophila LSv54]CAG37007.1 conserved hypothetical protein [Desulfotalea psychrophila LSv54]